MAHDPISTKIFRVVPLDGSGARLITVTKGEPVQGATGWLVPLEVEGLGMRYATQAFGVDAAQASEMADKLLPTMVGVLARGGTVTPT